MARLVLGCEFVSEHSMLIENVKFSRIISLIGKKHRGCLFLSLNINSISYFAGKDKKPYIEYETKR